MYISCKLVTDEFTSFLRMLHAILIAYMICQTFVKCVLLFAVVYLFLLLFNMYL